MCDLGMPSRYRIRIKRIAQVVESSYGNEPVAQAPSAGLSRYCSLELLQVFAGAFELIADFTQQLVFRFDALGHGLAYR